MNDDIWTVGYLILSQMYMLKNNRTKSESLLGLGFSILALGYLVPHLIEAVSKLF